MKEETPDPRLAMKFEKHGARWYQRRRNKHSSGDAEWHSRNKELRALGKAIGQWGRKP